MYLINHESAESVIWISWIH